MGLHEQSECSKGSNKKVVKHCNTVIVRQSRRKIGDRAFAVAAPRVWNRLPAELKIMRSTPAFKQHLKTYLFSSVYGAS